MTGTGRTRTAVESARSALGAVHAARALRGRPTPVLDAVLAVRQLGQAVLVRRAGTVDAHTASALVDALHGASMVPVALFGGRLRRFAAVQVLLAVALAVAEVAAVGRAGGHGSLRR
ncbi:hypothetical protein [Curtobacterium luteum]|uniref:Uncharacterized protein n=1 Tax=Curtobacterium luteum TaxID=33881 RepID=A0A175RLI7_9MICO|nr:hypothetical protein [Curtobacterium luteum]KTR04556.1 hypothetical protein NS184_11790 [Curtobacterium luteum]